jgi:hypothetical protein
VRPSQSAARAPARAGGERIDWATLLKRTFDIDALKCVCGFPLRVVATITERAAITKILRHIGEPITADERERCMREWDAWDPAPPDE